MSAMRGKAVVYGATAAWQFLTRSGLSLPLCTEPKMAVQATRKGVASYTTIAGRCAPQVEGLPDG
jgi:hypothetical protein